MTFDTLFFELSFHLYDFGIDGGCVHQHSYALRARGYTGDCPQLSSDPSVRSFREIAPSDKRDIEDADCASERGRGISAISAAAQNELSKLISRFREEE